MSPRSHTGCDSILFDKNRRFGLLQRPCGEQVSRMLHVFFTLVAANNNVVPNTRRLFVCGLQVFCLALFHRKINLFRFFSNMEKAALTAMLLRTAYSSSIVFT